MPSTLIPTAPHFWSLSSNDCRVWATGICGTVLECYRGHSQGPVDFTLSPSWPCAAGFCHWGPFQMYSGNTTLPTMRPRSDAFYDVICTHANHCPCRFHPAHSLAPICSANWRHGNMPVPSQCGTSLMQVVQKSIAPKDNLHHTSVFPLTVSLDVNLSSPPATMVPVHDMKHAPKGSAQATIRIR